MFDFNEGIGTLRSLLAGRLDATRRDELLVLLITAFAADPERYNDQWLPYLIGSRRALPDPLIVRGDVAVVLQVAECVPFATLHLVFDAQISDDDLAALGQTDMAGRITHLSIESDRVSSQGLIDFAGSSLLEELRFLRLASDRFGIAGLEPILSTPSFERLESLELRSNLIKESILDRLFACAAFGSLTHFSLQSVGLAHGWDTLAPLIGDLKSLTSLSLPGTAITLSDFFDVMARIDPARFLHLDLSRNGLDEAILDAFIVPNSWRALESLNLSYNKLGDEGVLAIVNARGIPPECRVDARHNALTLAGLTSLAAHPGREKILVEEASQGAMSRIFNLLGWVTEEEQSEDLRDLGASLPGEAALIEELECLDLRMCAISDRDIEALANLPALEHVRYLDLSENEISDDGFARLSNSPYLSKLEVLDISNNPSTGWGALFMACSHNLPALTELEFLDERLRRDWTFREVLQTRDRLLERRDEVTLIWSGVGYDLGWEIHIGGEYAPLHTESSDEFRLRPGSMIGRLPRSLQLDELRLNGPHYKCLRYAFEGEPLERVRRLVLREAEMESLLDIVHLYRRGARVEELVLDDVGIYRYYWGMNEYDSSLMLDQLARAENATCIRSIDLTNNYHTILHASDVGALLRAPGLANLERFFIERRCVSDPLSIELGLDPRFGEALRDYWGLLAL